MNSRPGPPVRIVAASLALFLGLSTPAAAGPPSLPPPSSASKQPGHHGEVHHQVTLITGDRVTLAGAGRTRITPGPGRGRIRFQTVRAAGSVLVIPSDVAADLAAGTLDRRLFDVRGLVDARYDDASTPTIPLIITSTGRTAPPALPGASVTRQLPSINATAVRVAKKDTATFLTGVAAARSGGGTKIWLDGKRRPTLDRSVPQIGAPAAWAAGFTGKGVPVAVLDSGADATHPDLTGRIAGSKNFVDGPPEDLDGHGTHVASTIAGTGAKYRGVAPDANLYAGKVCDFFCSDSAVLAGLEWAATEIKAKVVNLSIGGTDTPEVDPLEEAIDRLTEQTGTLFVVAAGNDGLAGTINSPGSAEAALTVGAVDQNDELAYCSSQGPRVGDGGIKPDVTAPGVEITAARPGGGHQAMSGTSMAAPHVTGAAALLAQQHPNWKAADLKAALMAAAKRHAGLTPFEQGSGRIDVAQGIRQAITTIPGNLGFGLAEWPHTDDKPVTKRLTYHNHSSEPLTLKLSRLLTGPDKQPAPDTALTLSATELTVPPGGTSAVDVTSDTRHDGPDGTYLGSVVATGPGVQLNTSVAVTKEIESYDLTVKSIDRNGKPYQGSVIFYDHAADSYELLSVTGSVQRRVPKGRYLIDGLQFVDVPGGHAVDVHQIVHPNVTVAADMTVTLDGRDTKPFDLTVPAADATPVIAEVAYRLTGSARGFGVILGAAAASEIHTSQVGTPLPAGELAGYFTSQWAKGERADSWAQSPYLYTTVDQFRDNLPTGLTRKVRADDLITVEQSFHRASHPDGAVHFSGMVAGNDFQTESLPIAYTLPAKRRVYLDKGDVLWFTDVAEEKDGEQVSLILANRTKYPDGQFFRERSNVAPFSPAPMAADRFPNGLWVVLSSLSDAVGGLGFSAADEEGSRLLRDGVEIARSDRFMQLSATGLPAEAAKYTLEATLDRSSKASFSTRVEARWNFVSSAKQSHAPLLGVTYHPKVDQNNTVARTAVTTLPLTVVPPMSVALPALQSVGLEYSGDDGVTWQKATVRRLRDGRYQAIFPTPRDADRISLRAHVTDTTGNTSDLTTIAAYPLR